MKLQEVLTQIDHVKPNQYDDATLVRWVSGLDGLLYNEIISWHDPQAEKQWDPSVLPYRAAGGMTEELLVPAPYDDIYVKYLCAQVDYHNAEFERYNNSMVMYNMALSAYADWVNRNRKPKQEKAICI